MTSNCDTRSSQPDKPICNICRQDAELVNLMTPCACQGSIGHVHYKCVKIWIETSGSDICGACKRTYSKGLLISKKAGRFGVFFNQSEMGRMYSQFTFLFLVMFYLSYFGQFHCRLAYQKGWISSAVLITVFNSFYLLIHTVLFLVYLLMIYLSFTHWRTNHFNIEVQRSDPVQA